jgi:hypothetical protein
LNIPERKQITQASEEQIKSSSNHRYTHSLQSFTDSPVKAKTQIAKKPMPSYVAVSTKNKMIELDGDSPLD